MAKDKKKPELKSEPIDYDHFGPEASGITGMGHLRKTKGVSGFDAMFYSLTNDPEIETAFDSMDDETYSDLIICELETSIVACALFLSRTDYLKSNPDITTRIDDQGYSVTIENWLDMNVLDFEGKPLFECFAEKGEDFELSDGVDTIPAIGIAVKIIGRDICRRGNLFSEEWYMAKILQEYFWPKLNRENQIFLMGVLWEQLAQKQEHEEYVMRGQSAAQADQKRGASGKSNTRKSQRLDHLLSNMEELVKQNPILSTMDAIHCGKKALELCVETNAKLWSQGQGQLENYLTEIASKQPYKKRYDAIFHKTA